MSSSPENTDHKYDGEHLGHTPSDLNLTEVNGIAASVLNAFAHAGAVAEVNVEDDEDAEVHEVIIVGSGPAGYTAAIYAARANLNPILFAGALTPGGELMNTTEVENYPGFIDGIMGPDLMSNMEQQAERFGAQIEFEDIVKMDLEGAVKTVITEDGDVYRAKAVIISTGSAYRKLGLPDEERLSGHGVSWCATCDGFFFQDKNVAVVGGGDSALEEALFLTKFAAKVSIIHRRDSFKASEIMSQRALDHEKIEVLWDSEVAVINGGDKVESLTLRNTKTGETSTLDATGLFVAIGSDPRTDLVKGVLELDPVDGTIKVDGRTSWTSVAGVFAAGDVIDGSYRQAITAAASGCVAAQDVEHYLAALEDPSGI